MARIAERHPCPRRSSTGDRLSLSACGAFACGSAKYSLTAPIIVPESHWLAFSPVTPISMASTWPPALSTRSTTSPCVERERNSRSKYAAATTSALPVSIASTAALSPGRCARGLPPRRPAPHGQLQAEAHRARMPLQCARAARLARQSVRLRAQQSETHGRSLQHAWHHWDDDQHSSYA